MALINQINGDLLLQLAGAERTDRQVGGSAGAGLGTSSSVDAAPASIRVGLSFGASLFASSVSRLEEGLVSVSQTKEHLERLSELGGALVNLARRAASEETEDVERRNLESDRRVLVEKFNKELEQAEKIQGDSTFDHLDLNDLERILEEAGIDLDDSNSISENVARLGGTDGELGFEKILQDDNSRANPLLADFDSFAESTDSFETLKKLDKAITEDLERVSEIEDQLVAARKFAFVAAGVFTAASESAEASKSVDVLAIELVGKIRAASNDTALSAHSDLDSELARELLGEDTSVSREDFEEVSE